MRTVDLDYEQSYRIYIYNYIYVGHRIIDPLGI